MDFRWSSPSSKDWFSLSHLFSKATRFCWAFSSFWKYYGISYRERCDALSISSEALHLWWLLCFTGFHVYCHNLMLEEVSTSYVTPWGQEPQRLKDLLKTASLASYLECCCSSEQVYGHKDHPFLPLGWKLNRWSVLRFSSRDRIHGRYNRQRWGMA